MPVFNTAMGEKINAEQCDTKPLCDVIDRLHGKFRLVSRVESAVKTSAGLRLLRLLRSHVAVALAAVAASCVPAAAEHGIAMHGRPAQAATFAHMPYANPDAPKGGRLTFGLVGTFDSLNPFIVRGLAVSQIRGHVVESLLTRGQDEPFTLYGLLAESVETNDARSEVTFRINPAAKFADGAPVTADDVLFSWALLRDKGRPNHRSYYSKVVKAEKIGERAVRFDFGNASDRELPLILGLMPVLPRHATDEAAFESTTLNPLVGSGPYRIGEVRQGARVTLTRDPNYWGRDLPINRGLWNFDEIRLDYYRESNAAFEAFKRGLYDVHVETEPGRWQTGYDFPAARDGQIVRESVPSRMPRPVEAMAFNTRRPLFADRAMREALTLLFDFDWINRNYFFGLYSRDGGFFPGSDLSAYGVAADARERALLGSDTLPAMFLDGTWRLPAGDIGGRDRRNLQRALEILKSAGYELRRNVLFDPRTRKPVTFEIMVTTREQERIALALVRDFKRAGIEAVVRSVDAVQFDQRRLAYDFDMAPARWDQSLSPGNEQSFYWGSQAARTQGTRNYMGINNPFVDRMIDALLAARDRAGFVAAVRMLDRALMSGFYVLPIYNHPAQWIARRNDVAWPARPSLAGAVPESWWRAPARPAR